MNHSTPQKPKTARWVLRLLMLVLIATTMYTLQTLQGVSREYDEVSARIANEPIVAKTAHIGENAIVVPTYSLFKQGQLWALVSTARPLHGEAGYTLVDAPVAHGDTAQPMKVAKEITGPLKSLVAAADTDGEPLMLSSAYRSLEEQQATYDAYVAKSGVAAAKQYVLPVGASEHHTGLAVDFSSVSDECAEDSNACSLSTSAAAWLAENAWKYGFILRYPDGARDITGVGFEPWHYRYVGTVMAKAMQDSDLAYDEVVQQLAPGYAREQK